MAITLKRTSDIVSDGVKFLVYGQSGAGKTYLCSTLPNSIILSAESGLLTLRNFDIPFIEINSTEDLSDAYDWVLESNEANQFETIAIDSLSEIAEVILSDEKAATKDPRAAYGEMQDKLSKIIRKFRDIKGKNVLMTAKTEKTQTETGKILYSPSMPGSKAAQSAPYFFDEVFALRVEATGEDEIERMLQCTPDGLWLAKDRSGALNKWELPNLGDVISKIKGGKNE